jgi:hypothetical protein
VPPTTVRVAADLVALDAPGAPPYWAPLRIRGERLVTERVTNSATAGLWAIASCHPPAGKRQPGVTVANASYHPSRLFKP